MSKSLREVRERLWKKDPHCRYCGVITVLPSSPLLKRGKDGKLRHYPDNMATIDHLRSRLDPERQNHYPSERRYILACWKCNNERSKKENSKLRIEELWKRSGRMPIAMSPSNIEFYRNEYE